VTNVHLLIVDDQPGVLWSFEQIFTTGNVNVYTALNGQEALDLVHAQPIDLVICDILMPVMDGIEFARRLRMDATTASIPLFFMSGGDPADYENLVRAYDALGFLAKPLDIHAMRALVTMVETAKKENHFPQPSNPAIKK
jgi:CheY-like chemotaxis protein